MKTRSLFGKVLDQIALVALMLVIGYAYFFRMLGSPLWAALCALALTFSARYALHRARIAYERRHTLRARKRRAADAALSDLLHADAAFADAVVARWLGAYYSLGGVAWLDGVCALQGGETAVRFLQRHPADGPVGATALLDAWRDAHARGFTRCALAAMTGFSPEAEAQAAAAVCPKIALIPPAQLRALALENVPVPDAQAESPDPPPRAAVSRISRLRKLLEALIGRERSGRYAIYGGLLLALYLLLGMWVYLPAALVCLLLCGLGLRKVRVRALFPAE